MALQTTPRLISVFLILILSVQQAEAGSPPSIDWSIAFNTDSTAHKFGAVRFSETEADIVYIAGAGDLNASGKDYPDDPSLFPVTRVLPEGVDLANALNTIGVWVGKLNYRTNQFEFFTFIVLGSGAVPTAVADLAFDSSGDIILVGSTTFGVGGRPPFPSTNSGGVAGCRTTDSRTPSDDGLIIRLSADGQDLKFACAYGGSGEDHITTVSVLPSDAIAIGGYTKSADLFTNVGYDTNLNGEQDGFIAVQLAGRHNYAMYRVAYVGGSGGDVILDSILVGANKLIFGGLTDSQDLFTTPDAIESAPLGMLDQFLIQVDPETIEHLYLSYLGATGSEDIQQLASDASGNVYLVGTSNSSDYPVVGQNALSPHGGIGAVVTKLDPDLSRILFSSFHGFSPADFVSGESIAVNDHGDLAIGGQTDDPLLYPAVNPLTDLDESTLPFAREYAHVIKWLNNNGRYELDYATTLGGDGSAQDLDLIDRENLLIGGIVDAHSLIDPTYHYAPIGEFGNSFGPFAMVISNEVPDLPVVSGGGSNNDNNSGGGGGGALSVLGLLCVLAIMRVRLRRR
ncbi:MAG: hypothetical protein EX272_08015 [Chromatiales bacterium]|nr:MAG: hypothetical protein EX272_08015 [Chromatiales bacterium]